MNTHKFVKRQIGLLVLVGLLLVSCSGNVGIGMSVGIPIGSHGYMSVGGTRWH